MPVAWCLTWLLQAVAAGDPLLIAVVPASSCSTISPLIGCYIRLPGTARESLGRSNGRGQRWGMRDNKVCLWADRCLFPGCLSLQVSFLLVSVCMYECVHV